MTHAPIFARIENSYCARPFLKSAHKCWIQFIITDQYTGVLGSPICIMIEQHKAGNQSPWVSHKISLAHCVVWQNWLVTDKLMMKSSLSWQLHVVRTCQHKDEWSQVCHSHHCDWSVRSLCRLHADCMIPPGWASCSFVQMCSACLCRGVSRIWCRGCYTARVHSMWNILWPRPL